jgi:hypothetical protein
MSQVKDTARGKARFRVGGCGMAALEGKPSGETKKRLIKTTRTRED